MTRDEQIDAMTAAVALTIQVCADVSLRAPCFEVLRKGVEAFVEVVCGRHQP